MRIKRSLQLWPQSANVHMYWRCHNRDFLLKESSIKNLYMKSIEDSLNYKKQSENCFIHAYCVMDNHYHQSITYKNGSINLSNFMRYAHGVFGARFNRIKSRSGSVSNGRPKTPLVQNDYYLMQLHFYIEANPIRAKFRTLENLKHYIYSSYGFYAYGIRTKFTSRITIPDWYIKLGKTFRKRQIKYRKLFRNYINENHLLKPISFIKNAIGDSSWTTEYFIEIKKRFTSNLLRFNEKLIFSSS